MTTPDTPPPTPAPTPTEHVAAEATVDQLAASIRALGVSDRESLLRQLEERRLTRLTRVLSRASKGFWAVVQHPRVGAIFMLAGLAIAFFSYQDAARQMETLKEISGEVSTSYLGEFPHTMEEMIELVRDTRHDEHIIMAIDQVGYGLLSNPEKHREFNEAIRDAAVRGVSIRIVTYDEALNRDSRKRQYGAMLEDEEAFQDFLDKEETATTIEAIRHLVKSSGRPSSFEDHEQRSKEWFLELLWEAEEKFRSEYRGLGIEICPIGASRSESPYPNDPLEIHFWASADPSNDWKRAIFAFKIYPADPDDSATETTFKTRDEALMNVLRGRWERWEDACEESWSRID